MYDARTPRGLLLVCALIVTRDAALGQAGDAEAPQQPPQAQVATSQPPTSQPAASQPTTPLRSPRSMMQFFIESAQQAIAATSEAEPEVGPQPDSDGASEAYAYEHYKDAMRCLDFSLVAPDAQAVSDVGPRYVRELYAILTTPHLREIEYFDIESPAVLPDKAGTLSPHSFGRNPIVLVLERVAVRPPTGSGEEADASPLMEWKFSAWTVFHVPRWHDALDVMLDRIQAQDEIPPPSPEQDGGLDADAMSNPWDALKAFIGSAMGAQRDREREDYAQARGLLDFWDVAATELINEDPELDDTRAYSRLRETWPACFQRLLEDEENSRVRVEYVDSLLRILQHIQQIPGYEDIAERGSRIKPEAKPTWAIGEGHVMVILVRQGSGQWRFASQTVLVAPKMADSLPQPGAVVTPAAPARVERTAAPPAGAETARDEPAVYLREEYRTPGATWQTFMDAVTKGDVPTALSCLDLSRWSEKQTEEEGPDLVARLWIVLTRQENQVSLVARGKERVDVLMDEVYRIQIGRQVSGERKSEWLFTARTVRDINRLYSHFERKPALDWVEDTLPYSVSPIVWLREYAVPRSLKFEVAALQMWQWLALLLALAVGLAARWILAAVLPPIGRRLLRTEGVEILPHVIRRGFLPLATLAMIAVWWGAMEVAGIGADFIHELWLLGVVLNGITWLLRVLTALAAARALYHLVNVLMGYFSARAARTRARVDDVLVPLLQKTMKVVVVALGFLLLVNALGFPITPMLATLGFGGLAISFAAKDTIANFFGSVSVVMDRPFQVGDWVKIGDSEGIIEDIGLRSTKLRTFWKSQIIVPNSEVMVATIENFQRRTYRRTYAVISVTYSTTPAQLDAFCEGIREIIRQHPHTWKEYYHVYVKEFADSSINIMLYCFHDVPDWSKELLERHRLLLDVIRLAHKLGVEFAFPTQTIHLARDTGEPREPLPLPEQPAGAMRIGKDEAEAIVKEFYPKDGD